MATGLDGKFVGEYDGDGVGGALGEGDGAGVGGVDGEGVGCELGEGDGAGVGGGVGVSDGCADGNMHSPPSMMTKGPI
jgi:hypothetical protein